MSKALTRDQIFGVNDRELVRVEVPEWGGHVFVRPLSGPEVIAYQAMLPDEDKDWTKSKAALAAMVAVDEDGNRIFADADAKRLAEEKNFWVVNRIGDAAADLNVLTAKAAKRLEKNSEGQEAPPSDSMATSQTAEGGA